MEIRQMVRTLKEETHRQHGDTVS